MHKTHVFIRNFILRIVDSFYPLFKSVMPLQTFRYAACGGGNTVLSILIFSISYNFILEKQLVHIGSVAISAHIFSFIISFCITFPIGFYLSRYVVWQQAMASKRIQLFRYFLVVAACVLINYFLLNFFVVYLGWWPTVSNIVVSIVVIAFSYLTQRHFSFKETE